MRNETLRRRGVVCEDAAPISSAVTSAVVVVGGRRQRQRHRIQTAQLQVCSRTRSRVAGGTSALKPIPSAPALHRIEKLRATHGPIASPAPSKPALLFAAGQHNLLIECPGQQCMSAFAMFNAPPNGRARSILAAQGREPTSGSDAGLLACALQSHRCHHTAARKRPTHASATDLRGNPSCEMRSKPLRREE